jgi:AsmA family
MKQLQKWWKTALVLVGFVAISQASVSLLVRTHRVHAFLIDHLEHAFGRPVEVAHFDMRLLPSPRLDADRVTIGEDPAFGGEYFLRAERLTAGLRWAGLQRAHFEFGTLFLSRPSLILVRNNARRWNLERWLPPAQPSARVYGPPIIATAANRLRRIDIDDGRIDFKIADDKLPFAFTGVSGSVDQVSPGRWRLRLAAQPWHSGAALQSAGTMLVEGDVAGTSARLQPAEIHVHWEQVSLADLLRLFRGRDYGVRGVFTLDAVANSGAAERAILAELEPGDWSYSIQARAARIHRWDLTERPDNPRVNASLLGRLNVVSGNVHATRVVVETSRSNLRGSATGFISTEPTWEIRVDSAGIQAADALAWYRAFQPGVDDRVTVEQYFTGEMTLRGLPLDLKEAAFSSEGGEAHIPGLSSPLRITAIQGGRERDLLTIEPVRISYGEARSTARALGGAAKRHAPVENSGAVSIGLSHNFMEHSGRVSIDGHLQRVEDALKLVAALGRPVNHGWELNGPVGAALRWEWNTTKPPDHRARWNGRVDMVNGEFQAAGLNQPLQVNKTTLSWKDGVRSFQIGSTQGFGAIWFGTIYAPNPADSDGEGKWNFQLHTDHLDAAELDRWIGPRARPSWLQRLLPSLLGGATPGVAASELLRRVNAEGELQIDEFTMEKLKLEQVTVNGALHDLHLDVRDAAARWGGGTVHGKISARFLPRPAYDVTAELEHIDLAQLPSPPRIAERFAGAASGTLHLTTQGVGREELLQGLAGRGEIRLHNVEFRGWDISASVADGAPRTGQSRWATGEGAFTLRDRGIVLAGLRLEAGREVTFVKGTVSFGHDANLTIQTTTDGKRESRTPEPGRVLKISGPLDVPRVSVERVVMREPAD